MTNLTDKWKRGELPEGEKYIQLRDGRIFTAYFNGKEFREVYNSDIKEILAEVPTFEEWEKLNNACHELEKETACLTVDNVNLKKWCEEFNALEVARENAKLKELLAECKPFVELCNHTPENIRLLKRINELLGE